MNLLHHHSKICIFRFTPQCNRPNRSVVTAEDMQKAFSYCKKKNRSATIFSENL